MVVYALILFIVLWITAWPAPGVLEALRSPLLALQRPRSWPRALGLALPTLLVAGLVISIIDSFLHGGREQGIVPKHFLHGHAGEYAANWIVIAGVAPFVEETTYRGLGFGLFFERFALWAAIFGTGSCSRRATGSSTRCPSSRSSASRSRGSALEPTASSPGCSSTPRSTASRWRACSGTSHFATRNG